MDVIEPPQGSADTAKTRLLTSKVLLIGKFSLRRMFGFDGYKAIRNRNWTITGGLIVALGLIADLTEILGPYAAIGFWVSFISACIFGVIIAVRMHFCHKFVVPFLCSVLMILIFGGFSFAQNSIPNGNENGFVLSVLNRIDETTRANLLVSERVESKLSDASIERDERARLLEDQLKELSISHEAQYSLLLDAITEEKGIPRSAILPHLLRLGASSAISSEEIPAFLDRISDELRDSRSSSDSRAVYSLSPATIDALNRSQSALMVGETSRAKIILGAAERKQINQGLRPSSDRAHLIAAQARIDSIELDYSAAATKFRNAAREAQANHQLWLRWELDAAEALLLHGEEFGGADALQDAIQIYRSILSSTTDIEMQRGLILNNLGSALRILGVQRRDEAVLRQSLEVYDEAIDLIAVDNYPHQWSMAHNNRGVVLQSLGRKNSDQNLILKAIASYRLALTKRSSDKTPREWVATQNNLGTALQQMFVYGGSLDYLKDASEAYGKALSAVSRDRDAFQWAMIQNNRGTALWLQGERTQQTDLLQDAVFAYQQALTVRTRERLPLDWASTQSNLATALWSIGTIENDLAKLSLAVTAYSDAMAEFVSRGDEQKQANTGILLISSLAEVGERSQDPFVYRQTATVAEGLVGQWSTQTRAEGILELAAMAGNLSCWHRALAIEYSGDTWDYQTARRSCERSIEAFEKLENAVGAAEVTHSLGYLVLVTGEQRAERRLVANAIDLFQGLKEEKILDSLPQLRHQTEVDLSRAGASVGTSGP